MNIGHSEGYGCNILATVFGKRCELENSVGNLEAGMLSDLFCIL